MCLVFVCVYVCCRVLRSGGGADEWADAIAKATHYTHSYKVHHTYTSKQDTSSIYTAISQPRHKLRQNGRIVPQPSTLSVFEDTVPSPSSCTSPSLALLLPSVQPA